MARLFAAVCCGIVVSAMGYPVAGWVIGTAMFFILGD